MTFNINKQDKTRPLYLQLAEQIAQAIENSTYAPGKRLPTEAALSSGTGLSPGTIKAAYHYLQQSGLIYKVRGSGVYVNNNLEQTPEQMVAALFDELTTHYCMSATSAYQLFQRQLVHAFAGSHVVHIAFVDCNIETIHAVQAQLEQIPGTTVSSYLLDKLLFSAEQSTDLQCDLVLTTPLHYPGVCRYTAPLKLATEPLLLRETKQTLAQIARLPNDAPVCAVYRSEAFLSSIRYILRLTKKQCTLFPCHEDDLMGLELQSQAGIPFLVPPDYLDYCNSQALQIIFRTRSAGGEIIPICYEIDQSSVLHITERIKSLSASKREGTTNGL